MEAKSLALYNYSENSFFKHLFIEVYLSKYKWFYPPLSNKDLNKN